MDVVCVTFTLKVIYHPLYSINKYVLIWGDWLSCDPLRGPITPYKETLIHTIFIRGDRSLLRSMQKHCSVKVKIMLTLKLSCILPFGFAC